MSIQRNLNDGDLKDILKRISKLEKAAPMNNAAIGRDGLLVYDGGVITIENGGLDVTGTATISGVLNVSGQTTLSGVTTIAGPTGITGPLTVQGTMDVTGKTTIGGNFEIVAGGLFKAGESVINPDGSAKFGLFDIAANGDLKSKGSLSIEGPTSLKSDLTVEAGKKIKLGGLVLENQGAGSAQVQMPGGGVSASTALGMSIVHSSVNIAANQLEISGNNARLTNLPAKVGASGNVHIDGNGRLWKTA